MRRGFTLLELVLVVIILGVIGALAVPRASIAQQRTRYTSAFASLRSMANAVQLYRADFGVLPGDVNRALVPPGMQSYLETSFWAKPSPIGGFYDWNGLFRATDWTPAAFWAGQPPSVAINRDVSDTPTQARFGVMDRTFDDGVAATGQLRRVLGTHLIYPVED